MRGNSQSTNCVTQNLKVKEKTGESVHTSCGEKDIEELEKVIIYFSFFLLLNLPYHQSNTARLIF